MIGNHKKAVLQFSGGKDSLAALYLARPWLDEIEVHFGDTGAVFPHIVEFVKRTCESLGANLKIVRPEVGIETYHKEHGLPSDIVPSWATSFMAETMEEKPAVKVQGALVCCSKMLWEPMNAALLESGATLCIRGVKGGDERLGVREERFVNGGIEYMSLVWSWTDGEVLSYLSREGAEIPPQYPEVDDGMDCWLCTGHLRTHYAVSRMKYVSKNYPDLMPELSRRAKALQDVLHSEADKVDEVLEIAING